MKKLNLLLILCTLTCAFTTSAQDTLDVVPGIGTLNAAIKQYKGGKIYRLKDGYNGYYVLNEIIDNTGFDLTIVGGGKPDANDPKPTMPATLQTSGTGGTPFNFMFNVLSNITLKGIYFINATADGVFNTQFFMGIQGNNIRVIIDKCVLDPSGSPIYCPGGSPKIYLTNNLFNRLTNQTTSVNGPVNFYFPNDQSGVDTLYIENNTFIGLSTAVFSDNFAPVKSGFTWINHNTFVHHKCQIDWMANQEKFYFTNNLLYDCHVIPYERAWVGGWDNYPTGAVSELLWSYPDSKVKDNGVDIDWGFDKMTSFVANNIEFKNQKFFDNLEDLYSWTASVGAPNSFYFQPLVWTPDVPCENRGIDINTALANNPQASIYNSEQYPTWKAANNRYDIDPSFTDTRIKQKSDILAQWALPAIKKDYFGSYYTNTDHTSLDWYWDPDGNMGQNETWPLFDGIYSNTEALNFGLDGLPAGDLNWYPAKKEIWEKNKAAIESHILSLNTTKMDLSSVRPIYGEKVVHIDIYPNPATDIIKINFNKPIKTIIEISVIDVLGRTVDMINSNVSEESIFYNSSALKPGIYYLKAKVDGIDQQGVFIKK
ncbi:MAG TPA: T9SS type A sorting domain-containing protein [Paludibacteraceae bacterium]|nr:T9SS type A sorting domain-containing protein [Paludibacteraceae bacterium]HPO67135.1 T9SS type A sorting domain-containing protein [Paludibacteraceae bacterium]